MIEHTCMHVWDKDDSIDCLLWKCCSLESDMLKGPIDRTNATTHNYMLTVTYCYVAAG